MIDLKRAAVTGAVAALLYRLAPDRAKRMAREALHDLVEKRIADHKPEPDVIDLDPSKYKVRED